MEFIELNNVFKVYDNGVSALADVNLKISKGEFVFIIGSTASGKSTLTKLLYREEKPNKGHQTCRLFKRTKILATIGPATN